MTPEALGNLAILRYDQNEFTILQEGLFVRCAVSNKPIRLDDLRYWNVALQEAYAGPEEALSRWKALQAEGQSA